MKNIKFTFGIFLALLSLSIVFISCRKNKQATVITSQQGEPNLPTTPYEYLQKHGVDNQIATLGRVLFYDKTMSLNNAVACGSCHKQEFAFADNVRFNKGANGVDLKRNSPSIQGIKGFFHQSMFNSGISSFVMTDGVPSVNNQAPVLLFWDGRQRSLMDMVLNPVLNHNEMNLPDFTTLVNRLTASSYYPSLFKNAFGDAGITKERIALALEGFVCCLNTDNSNPVITDQMNPNFSNNNTGNMGNPNNMGDPNSINTSTVILTDLQQQGKDLFHNTYNCATCHDPSNSGSYGTVSTPAQMFNIGLDEVYSDQGLGAITGRAGDKGMFKIPTLKNISLTAPYMHDGRYANLSEVLDHYSHGIAANANLSPQFRNFDGTPKKLNIAPAEKVALIAFLGTLTDNDFLNNPMYSDPFKK